MAKVHGDRPFRFGTGVGAGGPKGAVESARRAEALGFSTVGLSDHMSSTVAPIVGLQAIADATTSIRLTNTVLDQDFRHPAVLAKDLATLDVLSDGRLEVGIGAGWMRAEYDQSGIKYDSASVRIERLEEVVTILHGLFGDEPFSFDGKYFTIKELKGVPTPAQRPRPPLMIGGGGRRLLGVAARHADIVQVTFSSKAGSISFEPADFAAQVYEDKLAVVRDEAGDRFEEIELSILMMGVVISDDRDRAAKEFLDQFATRLGGSNEFTMRDLMESPAFAIGTVEQVCEKLLDLRHRFGFSHFAVNLGDPATFAPVIDYLANR